MKLNSSQKSSWGHYASTMPCSESPSSAKYAIESLSLDRTNIFGVCIHHTCTETAEKAREVLKGKKQSTHFIIDKNGDTTVELPLDKRAAAWVSTSGRGRLTLSEVSTLTNPQRNKYCHLQTYWKFFLAVEKSLRLTRSLEISADHYPSQRLR